LATKWKIAIIYDVLISEDSSWYSDRYNPTTEELPENWTPKEYIDIDIGMQYSKIWKPHENLHPCCSQPFDTMIIDRNGLVFPCCSVPQNYQYTVGNLIEENLEDIWQGKMLSNCRKFIRGYGESIQNTNSICERFPCMITYKSLASSEPLYSVQDVNLDHIFNKLPNIIGKKIMIWGKDIDCLKNLDKLIGNIGEHVEILGIVDDTLGKKKANDIRYNFYPPTQLHLMKPDVFLVSSQKHFGVIAAQLDTLGFENCERYAL
jgi:radical SAM protein with 4Fe4S-binding SPASM domain